MNDDRKSDKKEADMFVKSMGIGKPEEMAVEDTVEVLRGVCCFLLKELQKTYIHMARHAIDHDSMLHKDLGTAYSRTEEMLTLFFPDYLNYGQENSDDDGDKDG